MILMLCSTGTGIHIHTYLGFARYCPTGCPASIVIDPSLVPRVKGPRVGPKSVPVPQRDHPTSTSGQENTKTRIENAQKKSNF
jgi:hypothetical protein